MSGICCTGAVFVLEQHGSILPAPSFGGVSESVQCHEDQPCDEQSAFSRWATADEANVLPAVVAWESPTTGRQVFEAI